MLKVHCSDSTIKINTVLLRPDEQSWPLVRDSSRLVVSWDRVLLLQAVAGRPSVHRILLVQEYTRRLRLHRSHSTHLGGNCHTPGHPAACHLHHQEQSRRSEYTYKDSASSLPPRLPSVSALVRTPAYRAYQRPPCPAYPVLASALHLVSDRPLVSCQP